MSFVEGIDQKMGLGLLTHESSAGVARRGSIDSSRQRTRAARVPCMRLLSDTHVYGEAL